MSDFEKYFEIEHEYLGRTVSARWEGSADVLEQDIELIRNGEWDSPWERERMRWGLVSQWATFGHLECANMLAKGGSLTELEPVEGAWYLMQMITKGISIESLEQVHREISKNLAELALPPEKSKNAKELLAIAAFALKLKQPGGMQSPTDLDQLLNADITYLRNLYFMHEIVEKNPDSLTPEARKEIYAYIKEALQGFDGELEGVPPLIQICTDAGA